MPSISPRSGPLNWRDLLDDIDLPASPAIFAESKTPIHTSAIYVDTIKSMKEEPNCIEDNSTPIGSLFSWVLSSIKGVLGYPEKDAIEQTNVQTTTDSAISPSASVGNPILESPDSKYLQSIKNTLKNISDYEEKMKAAETDESNESRKKKNDYLLEVFAALLAQKEINGKAVFIASKEAQDLRKAMDELRNANFNATNDINDAKKSIELLGWIRDGSNVAVISLLAITTVAAIASGGVAAIPLLLLNAPFAVTAGITGVGHALQTDKNENKIGELVLVKADSETNKHKSERELEKMKMGDESIAHNNKLISTHLKAHRNAGKIR